MHAVLVAIGVRIDLINWKKIGKKYQFVQQIDTLITSTQLHIFNNKQH